MKREPSKTSSPSTLAVSHPVCCPGILRNAKVSAFFKSVIKIRAVLKGLVCHLDTKWHPIVARNHHAKLGYELNAEQTNNFPKYTVVLKHFNPLFLQKRWLKQIRQFVVKLELLTQKAFTVF